MEIIQQTLQTELENMETSDNQSSQPVVQKTLAQVAAGSTSLSTLRGPLMEDERIVEHVFIDTTRCHDCYSVPTHAAVVCAVSDQFPKDKDPDRVVLRQYGRFEGTWKIETKNVVLYRQSPFLQMKNKNIGSIEIRQERFR